MFKIEKDMNYKRIARQMPQSVKDKISLKMTGRKLSDQTKKKISDGQRRAWSMIPKTNEKKEENNNEKKITTQH